MAPLDYEILSKLMRYVFTVVGVLIVWRSFAWLARDRRETAKRIKALPDAGTIGILTVLRGSSELREGDVLPVPYEGVLGFVRTCDVVVPVTDVVAQHLDFTFRNGKGLYIYPRRGCPAAVDGVTIDSRADSHRYPMRHGSLLQVGEALLQLGVFAGLEVDQAPALRREEPVDPEEIQAPHVIQGQTGSYFQPEGYADPRAAYPPPACPPQEGAYPPPVYPPQPGAYPPPVYPPQAGSYPPPACPPRQDMALPPILTPPERRPGDEG